MKVRLVLFDLDGTLADTAPDIARASNQVLAEAGRPPLPLARVRTIVSLGARALVLAGFEKPPEEAVLEQMLGRLFSLYSEVPARATELFPGVAGLIGELAENGVRWGVVTNKPEALARSILATFELPPPACFVGGDTFRRKKPDPMPLLEACRGLGLGPDDAIYVGDAEIDARAARAAGMRCAIAGFGYAPPRADTCAWGAVCYATDAEALAQIVGLRSPSAAAAT